MSFTRYAIFHTPGPGPLADFCAGWLGWDVLNGTPAHQVAVDNLPLAKDTITETPRKYGFHGTIKPPFRLAPEQTEGDLIASLESFCAHTTVVTLDGLELAQLGRFLALIPVGDGGALNTLAAEVVRRFDKFRAPMTQAELARRRARPLNPRQEELLQQWGYPYVMEEFRFHLTLTSKLPKTRASATREALLPHLTPLLPTPFTLESLSLVGEGPDGRFRVIKRYPLAASI